MNVTLPTHNFEELYDAIRKELEDIEGPIEVDAIVQKVVLSLRRKRKWLEKAMEEMLHRVVRSAVYGMLAADGSGKVLAGTTVHDRSRFRDYAKDQFGRFTKWTERIESGVYMHVLEMTKDELYQAARLRRKRGDREYAYAGALETLAAPLAPGVAVDQHYVSEEELEKHLAEFAEELRALDQEPEEAAEKVEA